MIHINLLDKLNNLYLNTKKNLEIFTKNQIFITKRFQKLIIKILNTSLVLIYCHHSKISKEKI